ncbi:MAG: radical SAM protein [Anaerolineaceae bacterium]|nr:MAG: radical SAM protein [Anaerolineaceae bacterium]
MNTNRKNTRYDVMLWNHSFAFLEDDDCACSQSLTRIPKQVGIDGLRLQAGGDALKTIPVNSQFQIIARLDAQGSMAVLGLPGQRVLDVFANPSTVTDAMRRLVDLPAEQAVKVVQQLATLGFLQPSEQDCACASEDDCGPAVPSSPLTSWLHLTDRCNLRCDYCYLPHVREDMSSETGRAAIDATFRSAIANGFKQVKLKYAGGEPLLRFPLIVELHHYAQSLAEQHGLDLEGVVLSNGTLLTPAMVEILKSLRLRLMISLDGLGQHHDMHRRYAGGRGSFADVAEAVDLALANGLTPNISVTVSSRTAGGLPDVMAWILERELPFSLNFYRENELSASHEDMRLDEQKIINGMLAAFKVIEENLPRRPFLGGIIDRANLSASHTHTCGVGQNYLVFDQRGQIAKCQMHIRKPITDVHVADPLAVIRADQIGIQNISVEEKEGCKTCEWKYWCAGGCPLATYRATGHYDVKSPNCNIYKALFPEALRLEGLRLLKYQDDPEVVQKIVA